MAEKESRPDLIDLHDSGLTQAEIESMNAGELRNRLTQIAKGKAEKTAQEPRQATRDKMPGEIEAEDAEARIREMTEAVAKLAARFKEMAAGLKALRKTTAKAGRVMLARFKMIGAWLETIEARLDLREIEGEEEPAAFTPPEPTKKAEAEPEVPGEVEIPRAIFKKLINAGVRTEAEARALSETELANNVHLTMDETQELLRLFKDNPAGPEGQAGERS